MAQPGSIIGQITEEFEKLGEKVVKETVKAPKDIAGKALESLGTSGGQKGQTQTQSSGPLSTFEKTNDQAVKKAIARAALEELSGRKPEAKEPSVRERLELEDKQKKEMEAKKAEAVKKAELPVMTQKPRKGNLYAIDTKRSIEKTRNARQD